MGERPVPPALPEALRREVDRLRALAASTKNRRLLLGLTGAPGAGKSHVAAQVLDHLGDAGLLAAGLSMDGYHLAGEQLRRLGRADRKGAPDTFDAAGFVAMVRRVREEVDDDVYVPGFDRRLEEPVAAALVVPAGARLVVVEGNYLLLDLAPWSSLRGLLDEVWFLEPPEDVRMARLEARHREFGKEPDHALAWAAGPDEANAELVRRSRAAADWILSVG